MRFGGGGDLKVAAAEEQVDLDATLAFDDFNGLVDAVQLPVGAPYEGYLCAPSNEIISW